MQKPLRLSRDADRQTDRRTDRQTAFQLLLYSRKIVTLNIFKCQYIAKLLKGEKCKKCS